MGFVTEIELKAHVDDAGECGKKLSAIAGEGTAFFKDDTYWLVPPSSPAGPSGLRVRHETTGETSRTWITWKNKKIQDQIEVNEEHEFEVSDGGGFEELLVFLGLKKRIYKQKRGRRWRYQGITAELCEVSGGQSPEAPPGSKNLGWFLELEILHEPRSEAPRDTALAREELIALLEKAGIKKEHIESRYYSELLGTA